MRASSIVSAAVLLLCGGCIYATGVQDYKVDDDASCVAQGDGCGQCCVNAHLSDARGYLIAVQGCACQDPGTCSGATDCGSDFCLGKTAGQSCLTCVNQFNEQNCPGTANNAYATCFGKCPAPSTTSGSSGGP